MAIVLSRKFTFEAAHALFGYQGPCRFVHGHSYILEVRVESAGTAETWIPAPGLLIDFRELDQRVKPFIQEELDHRLLLSETYVREHPEWKSAGNLNILPCEPSVENLLLWLSGRLGSAMPSGIQLHSLCLRETEKSTAYWSAAGLQYI